MSTHTASVERQFALAMAMYRLDPHSTVTRNLAEDAMAGRKQAQTHERIRTALPTKAGR